MLRNLLDLVNTTVYRDHTDAHVGLMLRWKGGAMCVKARTSSRCPTTHQRAPPRLVRQDLEGVVRRLPGPEAERARPFELPTPVPRVSPHVDTTAEELEPFHEARAEATKPSP